MLRLYKYGNLVVLINKIYTSANRLSSAFLFY